MTPYRLVIGYLLVRLEGASFSRLRTLEKCVAFRGLYDPGHEGISLLFTSLHGVTSHKTGNLNANSRRFDNWGGIRHSLSTMWGFVVIY